MMLLFMLVDRTEQHTRSWDSLPVLVWGLAYEVWREKQGQLESAELCEM